MPGGEDLTKFVKKNPNTDARNLIEPSSDVRYLAMKVRAGQTKDIFELLDTTDDKLLYIDEEGRYLVYKPNANRGHVFIIKQGDETLIDAAIAEFSTVAWVSLFFPPGTWTCLNPLNLNNNVLRFFGAGGDLTNMTFTPAAPTSTPLITTVKNLTHIEGFVFSGSANTSSYLINIADQQCQIKECSFLNTGSGRGISVGQDEGKILDCMFNLNGVAIGITGQTTVWDVARNRFDGLSGGSSKGIQLNPSLGNARINIEDNWFWDIDTSIEIANLKTLLNSKIEGNQSLATTKHINHIGTVADSYLIHGNVFSGAGGFTIPTGVKQRDNIGLADAN